MAPINMDTCCWVISELSKTKGIKRNDAPGGKGMYVLPLNSTLS